MTVGGLTMRLDIGKLAPALAILLLVGTIALGLAFVLTIAFGYLPALGGRSLTADHFRNLFADPRLVPALASTLIAGITATLAATLAALALVAGLDPSGDGQKDWSHRLAVSVLAVPHVALALGLAFVLAPSGWIMRGMAALTDWFPVPPDWQLVPDTHGLALALALFIKETPFLFIAMVTALAQLKPAPMLLLARSFGYQDHVAWVKLVLPQLYPLIRFPILAVLAYGLSVVDMALVLGPSTPATFPVLILRWANDPDLDQRFLAASAASLQLALVAGAVLLWWLGERTVARSLRPWLTAGRRAWPRPLARLGWYLVRGLGAAALILVVLSLGVLLIWSFAHAWRYPDLLPDMFNLNTWQRVAATLAGALASSLGLAVFGTILATALAMACLEHEKHLRADDVRRAEKWLFLPLVVPEVSFLIGVQVLLLLAGLNGGWLAVAWLHLLFIFPYVFLTLKEPWRSFDPRYECVALTLGLSPWRVFWRVKLPLLRGAIAWAAAIGCSVSLSLYLPTVLAGEGRIVTLASEAIALSAGGDRRVIGAYGIVQALAAGLFFALALAMLRRRKWLAV